MGRTMMPPGGASADHHHGDSETGIYVVSGTPEFAFREHHEENPSAGTEAVPVAARPAQEAIVVNLPGL